MGSSPTPATMRDYIENFLVVFLLLFIFGLPITLIVSSEINNNKNEKYEIVEYVKEGKFVIGYVVKDKQTGEKFYISTVIKVPNAS